jgi:hypothetical protein
MHQDDIYFYANVSVELFECFFIVEKMTCFQKSLKCTLLSKKTKNDPNFSRYFIFLNSRMAVSKVSLVKQFGLMHLIGTNLCVWLNVLVQETKHEIHHFYDPENRTIKLIHGIKQDYLKPLENLMENRNVQNIQESFQENENEDSLSSNITEEILHRVRRGLKGKYSMYDCGRSNIIGNIIGNMVIW